MMILKSLSGMPEIFK